MSRGWAAGGGLPTKPLVVGAPLPDSHYSMIVEPDAQDVRDELTRAKVELMYAVAMHRKAWQRYRKVTELVEAEQLMHGAESVFANNDTRVAMASSGVSFWRAEMEAQAAVVTALSTFAESEYRNPTPNIHYS